MSGGASFSRTTVCGSPFAQHRVTTFVPGLDVSAEAADRNTAARSCATPGEGCGSGRCRRQRGVPRRRCQIALCGGLRRCRCTLRSGWRSPWGCGCRGLVRVAAAGAWSGVAPSRPGHGAAPAHTEEQQTDGRRRARDGGVSAPTAEWRGTGAGCRPRPGNAGLPGRTDSGSSTARTHVSTNHRRDAVVVVSAFVSGSRGQTGSPLPDELPEHQRLLAGIDWKVLRTPYGDGGFLPAALAGILDPDPVVRAAAFRGVIEATDQSTIYEATVPVVRFVAAVLNHPATATGDDAAGAGSRLRRPTRAVLLEWLGGTAVDADDERVARGERHWNGTYPADPPTLPRSGTCARSSTTRSCRSSTIPTRQSAKPPSSGCARTGWCGRCRLLRRRPRSGASCRCRRTARGRRRQARRGTASAGRSARR